MISQEIIDAYNAVMLEEQKQKKRYPTQKWKTLFDYYNSSLPEGARKLSMSCMPCYRTVINFVRDKMLQESQDA